MNKFFRCGTALTVTLLAIVTCVSAQERRDQDKNKPAQPNTQRPQQPAQPVPGQPAAQQMGQPGDRQLAACLISDNEGEIAIAKFAVEKSQKAEVKEFAQQMVKDHGEFLSKLQRFVPGTSTTRPESDDAVNPHRRDEQRRPGTTESPNKNRDAQDRAAQDRPAENRANAPQQSDTNPKAAPSKGGIVANPPFHGAQGIDLIRIKQEIGRECVATLKKELSAKSSEEFDECYVGQQIGAHLHMVDTLKVMKKYASPELRTVLEEGEKTAAEHLDHAKSLMKDLEGKSKVKRTAANPDGTTKEKD